MMTPTVAIATYDAYGKVLQLSHTLTSDLVREDVVGSTVHDWGDAASHLAKVLFTPEHYHVADISWDFQGVAGVTRVTSMRLHSEAVAVVVTHHYRNWRLTEVELETIRHMSLGASVEEAAKYMHLSLPAVRSALVRVRTKLRAKTTAQAVAICCHAGLI